MNTLQIKKFLQGQLFEINQQMAAIYKVKEETKEIGANLSALGSHNQDIIAAVGIGYNVIPGILDEVRKKYQVMRADIESYMNGL